MSGSLGCLGRRRHGSQGRVGNQDRGRSAEGGRKQDPVRIQDRVGQLRTASPIAPPALPALLLLLLAPLVAGCFRSPAPRPDAATPTVWEGLGPRPAFTPEPEPYPVTRVVDGDTLKLRRQGREVTVRLMGINSPESVDPRRPVQCFGREASKAMKRLVEGQRLYFAFDPEQEHQDRSGRLLGYLWLEDGRLVNLAMIQGGYANQYTYDDAYLLRDLFRQAAREAERTGRGLWAADTCAGDFGAPAGDFGEDEGLP